jgi:hypothetical protein
MESGKERFSNRRVRGGTQRTRTEKTDEEKDEGKKRVAGCPEH